SVWTTYLYTALVGTVIASLMVPFVWSWPDISDLPLILFMGLAGALGQFLLIVAFTYAPASLLAPFLYSSMIWSAAMGFLVFSEVPDHFTILGATMIVAGGFYVRHRERIRAQKQTN
ncbi:MAG: DMT family transporter, partial [Pseudomonadota bacterium]